jgi:hypothetical protein
MNERSSENKAASERERESLEQLINLIKQLALLHVVVAAVARSQSIGNFLDALIEARECMNECVLTCSHSTIRSPPVCVFTMIMIFHYFFISTHRWALTRSFTLSTKRACKYTHEKTKLYSFHSHGPPLPQPRM